ncbi:hypothetical protein G7054_g4507 [Neopestalotiopsis clavispora]|nr:hypothetical protein G7054_g4507 [Neopestalotiopsis clavispora]
MHRSSAFPRRPYLYAQHPWAQHPFAHHAYYYRFGRRPGMGLFKLAIVGAGAYFIGKKVSSNEHNNASNMQQQPPPCVNCGQSTMQQQQATPPGYAHHYRQPPSLTDQALQQARKEMAMAL